MTKIEINKEGTKINLGKANVNIKSNYSLANDICDLLFKKNILKFKNPK